MSNHVRVLTLLLSSVLVTGPAAASAAAAGSGSAVRPAAGTPAPLQARLGGSRGGFGRRSPSFGRRRALPSRRMTRSPFRGIGRSILHALGIAFLLHALFGWGAGGSPLGLLLLLAIVLWIATRRRRARYAPYGYHAY
jgi:hypothetical protein